MTNYGQYSDYEDPAHPSRVDLFLALFAGAVVCASALYILFFG